jgi:hypothetical protein
LTIHMLLRRLIPLFFILMSAGTASAAGLGLDVKSMPVGLKANYVDSDGQKFSWVYRGRFGKDYQMLVTGVPPQILYFNADGYRTKLSVTGYFVSYRPYFCNRQLGACKFRYVSDWSKYAGVYLTKLTPTKDGHAFEMMRPSKQEDSHSISFYKFTRYNLIQEYVSGSYWFRLVNIEMP